MASLRSLPLGGSVLGVILTLVFAVGCGTHGEDEDGPPAIEDGTIDDDDEDDVVPPPPDPPGNYCSTLGETKECTVYLPEVNGIVSCFVGQQVCEKDAEGEPGWSECLSQEDIDERIAAMEANGDL